MSARLTDPRAVLLVLFASLAPPAQAAETTSRHAVSLKAGEALVTAVVLTNTHARACTDISRPPMTPNQCSLATKDAGVVWRIVVEGAAMAAKEITLLDDTGTPFQQVCWSSSGSVYKIDAQGNRTGGGPQTEFLAAGPEAPRQVTLKIGEASAVITLAK